MLKFVAALKFGKIFKDNYNIFYLKLQKFRITKKPTDFNRKLLFAQKICVREIITPAFRRARELLLASSATCREFHT